MLKVHIVLAESDFGALLLEARGSAQVQILRNLCFSALDHKTLQRELHSRKPTKTKRHWDSQNGISGNLLNSRNQCKMMRLELRNNHLKLEFLILLVRLSSNLSR